MLKNFTAFLFGCFISIIILELLLPLVTPIPTFMKLSIDELHGEGKFVLSDNPRLLYAPKPNTGDYNADGYKGKLFSRTKNPEKVRILFMGDSVVDGINVPLENRFTHLLNEMLAKEYEFINLAVPGYNLAQEIEYLKQKGLKLKPDIVLFGITFNDLETSERTSGELLKISQIMEKRNEKDFYKFYYTSQDKMENIFSSSNIYRYAKYLLHYKGNEGPFSFAEFMSHTMNETDIKELLSELNRLSAKHAFKPVFILLPINDPKPSPEMAQLKSLANEAQIRYLDLDVLLSKKLNYDLKSKIFLNFSDPCHFNEQGHRVVAHLIHENMRAITR